MLLITCVHSPLDASGPALSSFIQSSEVNPNPIKKKVFIVTSTNTGHMTFFTACGVFNTFQLTGK